MTKESIPEPYFIREALNREEISLDKAKDDLLLWLFFSPSINRADHAPGQAGRIYFCPLCGNRMLAGSFHSWCEKHGAFEVSVTKGKHLFRKLDSR